MADFVDPFLITITIVLTICLIFVNIYFLAHYSHHADSLFGSSTAAKAVLVSCLIASYLLLHYVLGSRLHAGSSTDPNAAFRHPKHSRRH